MRVERVRELPDDFARLAGPAAAEGFAFLERVRAEWAGGANRFDEPGEALFACRADGELIGVCGLNVDPYGGGARVGRLRNLYVHPDRRGLGAGAALARAVLARAQEHFARLRLRAANAALDAYYRRLGFTAVQEPQATHALELRPARAVELADVSAGDDLARLAAWLAREHVARWWSPAAQVLAEARAAGVEQQAWIHWGGRAVGWLRWRHPTRAELDEAGLLEVPASAIDVDLLIGEPDALGHGVAPRALRLLRERLAARADATALILCTSRDNVAAARAFQAAGLGRRRLFEDPGGGPTWIFLVEL